MKNKRGGVLGLLGVLIVGLVLGWIALEVIMATVEDIKEYKEYKEFCEEREDFCLCEYGECIFKSQWSSSSGLSRDSRDLCKLAKKFEDKRTMFKIGCD